MSSKLKLDILVEEYKIISENIEQFQRVQVNYLISLFLIIGGMIGFYFSKDLNALENKIDYAKEFYHLFPLTLAAFISLISYHYRRIIGFQGYKRYLEEQINSELNSNTIFYSLLGLGKSKYLKKPKINLFLLINWMLYISIYFFSIYIAMYKTDYDYLITVYIIITILLVVGLVISLNRFNNVYNASLKESQEVL